MSRAKSLISPPVKAYISYVHSAMQITYSISVVSEFSRLQSPKYNRCVVIMY